MGFILQHMPSSKKIAGPNGQILIPCQDCRALRIEDGSMARPRIGNVPTVRQHYETYGLVPLWDPRKFLAGLKFQQKFSNVGLPKSLNMSSSHPHFSWFCPEKSLLLLGCRSLATDNGYLPIDKAPACHNLGDAQASYQIISILIHTFICRLHI
jgi:hypothetical protein